MNSATDRAQQQSLASRLGLPDLRRLSLATSTALRVLLIGFALSVLFSWLGMRSVQQQESERIVEHVSSLISTVELTVRVACFTGDSTLAREVSNGLLSNRAVSSVRIVSGTTMLADVGKQAETSYPPEATVIRRAVYSPFNQRDEVGEVALLVDDAFIKEQASDYAWFVALTSLLEMLIIAATVAWVVMHTVVRPIKTFSSALRQSGTQLPEQSMDQPQQNELDHMITVFDELLNGQQQMLALEQGLRAELIFKEKRYRALAENSPNLIVRYDKEFRRTYCNPAYHSKLNFSDSEVLGSRPSEMWCMDNLDAHEYESILQEVMNKGRAEHVLLEWFGKNGQYLVNDFHLVPEVGENGQIDGVLAIGHDISALKLQQRSDHDRSQVFEQIVQGGELMPVLDRVVSHVERALPGYRCAMFLLDAECGRLKLVSAPWMADDYRGELELFAPATREPGDFWRAFGDLAWEFGLRFSCNECIYDQNRNRIGALVLYQIEGNVTSAANSEFLGQACNLAAIAIERKRSEEVIRHQASYDALTDLPNRRMFLDRLRGSIAKAERDGGNVALLFIDLDRFKGVNDTLGHEVGDQLLVEAAARIQHCVRESDLVARLGGDEFVVLVPDVKDGSRLARLAQAIAETLGEPFELGLHIAYVSASIGIASYPEDAPSPDRLVSCADQAMYAAKDAGRNGYHFYSVELSESANQRLEVEVDLRHALRHDEFELYYQPKIDFLTGAVNGAEALVRWNHPKRGMVAPDKFIPVAEDCGLIMELGEWVLRDACRTAACWNSAGLSRKVAINLSARQFQTSHLFEQVVDILSETACRPEWIELEITESLLLEEGGGVLETLQRFRELGISIAIDDFGTGYSALSYLARFPINTLKIDRSFTRHVTDSGYHTEVVKAILSIAQSLGQTVVAEGVETEEQAGCLRDLGCDVAQGYLYSKPVSREIFESSFNTADVAEDREEVQL